MAGAGALEVVEPFELVVAVENFEDDRAAERDAVPDAGADFDGVGFDALAAAATVAALAALEFDVDRLDVDRDAGGKAVDERDQCFAVGFAGGEVAEHGGGGFRIRGYGGQGRNCVLVSILVEGFGCR